MRTSAADSQGRLAWLFDVDGTLLLTDGAARESFSDALRDVLGIEDDLTDVAFAGRTEPLILGDILRKHGRRFNADLEQRYWESVFANMRRNLRPDRGWLMPGALDLVAAVEREPGWVAGLLTGNMTGMAHIKLARFGIEKRFAFGAFGEEAPDRNALAVLAVERVRARYGIPPEGCIVVGDTEHDITCARAAGAHVIAVATGFHSRTALEACGPDLMLDDLTDTAGIIAWARARAAAAGAPGTPG